MTEADILAATYEDSVTVYRAYKTTLPNGESVFLEGANGKVIAENEPCAMSSQSGGNIEQSNSIARADTAYCLFTRPELDIQANDFLVIEHLKKTVEAVAGFPDRLSSHNNIPIKLDKSIV